MVDIRVHGDVTQQEAQRYVDYLQHKYNRKLKWLEITPDGDEAELRFKWESAPFERIRRITGYLVGDMSKWNDGKTAEERDRVKHTLSKEMEVLLP